MGRVCLVVMKPSSGLGLGLGFRVKSSLLCVGEIGFLDFHNFKFSFTPKGGFVKGEMTFFFIKSFDERHQRVSMIIKERERETFILTSHRRDLSLLHLTRKCCLVDSQFSSFSNFHFPLPLSPSERERQSH